MAAKVEIDKIRGSAENRPFGCTALTQERHVGYDFHDELAPRYHFIISGFVCFFPVVPES